MPVDKESSDNGLIVAALLAIVTNWDQTESRTGRRGEYRTTGASMYRIRELTEEEIEQLKMAAGALGLALEDEDLASIFAGDYEYQVSYACNRFETRTGGVGSKRLTTNEVRTLERARAILGSKEDVALKVLTRDRDRDKVA